MDHLLGGVLLSKAKYNIDYRGHRSLFRLLSLCFLSTGVCFLFYLIMVVDPYMSYTSYGVSINLNMHRSLEHREGHEEK